MAVTSSVTSRISPVPPHLDILEKYIERTYTYVVLVRMRQVAKVGGVAQYFVLSRVQLFDCVVATLYRLDSSMNDEGVTNQRGLPNPHLSSLNGDFLYHLGFSRHEIRDIFHDVKVGIIMY